MKVTAVQLAALAKVATMTLAPITLAQAADGETVTATANVAGVVYTIDVSPLGATSAAGWSPL